jgi:hypothetical protein
VKICVAGVEVSGKNTEVSKQGEIRFSTKKKMMLFWVYIPLNAHFLFCKFFFFESHPVLDQTQGSGAVFS